MVAAVSAVAGTLVAALCSGVVAGRVIEERQGWLAAWLVAALASCLALVSVGIGELLGYGPAIFRSLQLGGALLAPLWLSIGLADLVVESIRARFATRLIGTSFSLLAAIVVLADPLAGAFAGDFPASGEHWNLPPKAALGLAHTAAVLAVAGCLVLTLARSRGGDAYDWENLRAALATGPAAFLLILAVRLEPSPALIALALAAAAGAVWYAVARPLAPYDPPEDVSQGTGEKAARDEPPPVPAARAPMDDLRAGQEIAAPPSAPSPKLYGRVSVYTLAAGMAEYFDRLADLTVAEVRAREPDTLIYICHTVPDAPQQRIFYELFRDELAFVEHQQQPHTLAFLAEHEQYVVAANVIELTPVAAKVVVAPALLGL